MTNEPAAPDGDEPSTPPKKTFAELGLRAELVQALEGVGFSEPTPVQASAIPSAIAGNDLLVQSRTGSGKTAAFALPLCQLLAEEDDRSAVRALPSKNALRACLTSTSCAPSKITSTPSAAVCVRLRIDSWPR